MKKATPEYPIRFFIFLFFNILFFICYFAFSQDRPSTYEKEREALRKAQELKSVQALRLTEPLQLDGFLKEKIYQQPPVEDFIQTDPIDGAPATEKTKVWVFYDNSNLYVAALCYDSNPKGIVGQLGRRDYLVDSDWFIFYVDPYYDRRSGYAFWVNPSGSIIDKALYNDISEDKSWDGIWEARTQIVPEGWSVEIRIPFNQLRFPKKEIYIWGVNFQRIIKRKNEKVSYAWVPKEDNAFVSRFARLEGIRDINPGRRIEAFPYTVGQAQFRPSEPGNPFETGHKYKGNIGFDLKAGLKSNLNLDLTINPDFGQVEVDPAVINLTAYETYYEEKRPFFIEGASIFNNFGRGGVYISTNLNWPDPSFFYSRRIGRQPQGYVTHEGYVDFPDRSTIIGAFKLTGKLGSGWNIGIINAVTAREYATVDDLTNRYKDEVAPFTYYGIFRTLKEFNKGQQGLGFLLTSVIRDLRVESLQSLLSDEAFSLGFDGWSFLDKKRNWVFGGWAGGTFIHGSQEAIYLLQRSSIHYYQRPDVTHVSLNPEATNLSGWGAKFNLAKQQGHSLVLISAGALSPGFDPNDAGYQRSLSDKIDFQALYGYQWTRPGRIFQQSLLMGGFERVYDFGWNKTFDAWLVNLQGIFKNWWAVNAMVTYYPKSYSNTLTRGGPLALIPEGYYGYFSLDSDSRKKFVFYGTADYTWIKQKQNEWDVSFGLRWKPKPNFNLSIAPEFGKKFNETQWITSVSDPLMIATYGRRYIFGRIDQTVVASEIRLNWIFTPQLSLQVYLQPYIAVGKYDRLKQLNRPRAYDYLIFGQAPSTISFQDGYYFIDPDGPGPAASFSIYNPDFNYKSLRGTIVLRWEYRLGSLLYLVWTQNRADYSHPGDFSLGRDLGDLFTAPGDNVFLIKVTYRLNF
ncbi:MAG: carbohydrate binding family 9 domain-containing protein [Candidatus Aminicenantes bacterium]|nr:carbohydrate binding family 9 domain-containing protein [Candidatus Aminicenantes bacterium]